MNNRELIELIRAHDGTVNISTATRQGEQVYIEANKDDLIKELDHYPDEDAWWYFRTSTSTTLAFLSLIDA